MSKRTIGWRHVARACKVNWSRPTDLRNDLGLSQSTTMAAWHGKPVGLLPFLLICQKTNLSPLDLLSGTEGPPTIDQLTALIELEAASTALLKAVDAYNEKHGEFICGGPLFGLAKAVGDARVAIKGTKD